MSVNGGINLKVKGQGHWERKCKNCAYLHQKWIDLRQTNTV